MIEEKIYLIIYLISRPSSQETFTHQGDIPEKRETKFLTDTFHTRRHKIIR